MPPPKALASAVGGDQTMKPRSISVAEQPSPTQDSEADDEQTPLGLRPNRSYGGYKPKSEHRRHGSLKTQRSKSVLDIPASPKTAREAAAESREGVKWLLADRNSTPWAVLFSEKTTKQSLVLAPDDGTLPPKTLLLGSSKFAANAVSADLRRRASRGALDAIEETENGEGSAYAHLAITESEEDKLSTLNTMGSCVGTAHTLKEIEEEYREKTRTTFYQDAITFAEGTIPQSIVVATVIGVVHPPTPKESGKEADNCGDHG